MPSIKYIIVYLILACVCFSSVQAEVVLDGSLGTAGGINGPDFKIPDTVGQQSGNNLFHSFSQFNIDTGESATFTGPDSIQNVISRVTGGSGSNIDGLIDSSAMPNANFFLINPAGVVFGPNASLNIGGSLHTATADYIKFGDGEQFFADPLESSVLSVASIDSLGFTGSSFDNITVNAAQLTVNEGQTIALMAGEVVIENGAKLTAAGGQVNVVAVGSPGEVLNPEGDIDTSAFSELGDVTLRDSELNTDGEGGGRIFIRSNELNLEDSVLSARTEGEEDGQGIEIDANQFNFIRSRIDTRTENAGNAGDITIQADTILFDVRNAEGEVGLFTDKYSVSSALAGNINITTNTVNILGDSPRLSTTATPQAGLISINSADINIWGLAAEFIDDTLGSGYFEITQPERTIIFDGSLGAQQALIADVDNHYTIDADFGQIRAGNLFHSFSDFVLLQNYSATFSGPAYINNIISRVTGGNPSFIDGILGSDIAGANLFFLNPAGVIFGEQAQLNISGSVHITTADYLKFADNALFDRDVTALSSVDVSAFGFIDETIGDIIIDGAQLEVGNSEIFSLVGGDIIMMRGASLTAPSGQMNIISVGSTGEALLGNEDNPLAIHTNSFSQLGDIDLENSFMTVNGDNGGQVWLRSESLSLEGASKIDASTTGDADAQGIDLDVRGSLQIFDGGIIELKTYSNGHAGSISIQSGTLRIEGGVIISSTYGSGHAEDITIDVANQLDILNGGKIVSDTKGEGNAGSISITSGTLQIGAMGGQITGVFSDTHNNDSNGSAGNITIDVANQFDLLPGGIISSVTRSHGDAGDVSVTADAMRIEGDEVKHKNSTFIASNVMSGSSGNSGTVRVDITNQLDILNNGIIGSSTFANGNAGSVRITSGTLYIDGKGAEFTGLFSAAASGNEEDKTVNASSSYSGNAGDIIVNVTKKITLLDGGNINTSSLGLGDAGMIMIQANQLELMRNGAISSSTSNSGNAGSIFITANQMNLSKGGQIRSASTGTGNAGIIEIGTVEKWLSSLTLDGVDTEISSAVTGSGGGSAGSIKIYAQHFDIKNDAIISTATAGQGEELGSIEINSEIFGVSQAAQIQASTSGIANAGNISVHAQTIDVNSGALIASLSEETASGGAGSVSLYAAGDVVIDNATVSIETFDGQDSTLPAPPTINLIDDSIPAGPLIHIKGQNLTAQNNAQISASSTGSANAGSILIETVETIELLDNASVKTVATAAGGGGGKIVMKTRDYVYLNNSVIKTSVQQGAGGGGDIWIDSHFVVLNDSQILAQAFEGDGGNITIITDFFMQSGDTSLISASSDSGNDGVKDNQGLIVEEAAGVDELPINLLNASHWMAQACSKKAGHLSSFVVKNILPMSYDGLLASPLPAHTGTSNDALTQSSGGALTAMLTPSSQTQSCTL